ncbi:MAG: metallophosphoesterase [Hespellia sp.]|nr:metallophosphoesterase [Hespellia sp.]
MRILIVSDTHGHHKGLEKAVEFAGSIDMLIHLGDVEGEEDYIAALADCQEIHMVRGNNDFFSELPREEEFMIGPYKTFISHGHNYYVSMGPERIKEEGRSRGMDIVMFGHTHKPLIDRETDIIAINPGSLSYPRQEGRRGSFIIMELDENNKMDFQEHYL